MILNKLSTMLKGFSKEKFDKLLLSFTNRRVLFILFFLAALLVSLQSIIQGNNYHEDVGINYNYYNNYSIFKHSFFHLVDFKDLYIEHISDHFDLYKYSPTFAVFFGVFAYLPDWLGLTLWNLLGTLSLFASVYYLPRISNKNKGLILIIVLIELITSIQNAQTNALIAALFIYTFGFLERKNYALATLSVVFTVFIKIFGIVAFALFLLYPNKLKAALWSVVWVLILFLAPLIFIDLNQYKALLISYVDMLSNDHSGSYGLSVIGWLYTWFGLLVNKFIVVILGALVFMIPLIKINNYKYFTFRLLMLSSLLLWVVIFNHKAESPTFIIAMSGVAIWFGISERSIFNIILFICALILTSLSPTDIFPAIIRESFVVPYVLKAVPCIIIWIKIVYDLMIIQKEYSGLE